MSKRSCPRLCVKLTRCHAEHLKGHNKLTNDFFWRTVVKDWTADEQYLLIRITEVAMVDKEDI